MSNLGSQINFKQLLERHKHIRIPMIQRDYAQGRPAEKEVRDEFLGALENALKKSANDPSLPLNLDFIYGTVEGKDETRFLPLDGQQRLTTLFLLHWYLAWNDQQWSDFTLLFRFNGQSRFSYRVRPSSNEFFAELVSYQPACLPQDIKQVSQLISDQPWYFRSWRLDPTIQSAITMLDDIHHRFSDSDGSYARLINVDKPAITFQLLDLDHFGLSDDLYIKMNARGKPLTPFETFKARYEQELEKHFEGVTFPIGAENFTTAEFVARRMDTRWADLFWFYRDSMSNLYDYAVMNVFRAVALITRDPENQKYLEDVTKLRNSGKPPSYPDFYSRDWLDHNFTITLIRLLEKWSSGNGALATLLPGQQYFNEEKVFGKIVSSGADLTYVETVQLTAYATFICTHYDDLDAQAFQEWMRIIFNLSVNTSYDRTADMQRSIAGILKLICYSGNILEHFATSEKPTTGFSEQQIEEERLKAELIRADSGWRPLIDRAEEHGYFSGQIEFLLDFSGASEKWKNMGGINWEIAEHISLQERFENYLKKAELLFNAQGLARIDEYRWERALICLGDYLLPSGRNHSFLVNTSTDQASWKRLLRGTGPSAENARNLVHQLFDRLDSESSVKEQLDTIIADATGLEPWRQAFVQVPEAIAYCRQRAIRRNSNEQIYLLKRSQMNGTHAELFTFCLYQNLLHGLTSHASLAPLELQDYQSVCGKDIEPHILIVYTHQGNHLSFSVEFVAPNFIICIDLNSVNNLPDIYNLLTNTLAFQQCDSHFIRKCSPDDIQKVLLELGQALADISSQDVTHA